MVTRRTAIALTLAAAVLAACQVIAGIEEIEKQPISTASGSSGTSGTSGTSGSSGNDPEDPCVHVYPPAAPNASDPGADLEPFYVAAKTFSLSKPAANGIQGFDLDNTCTCDNRPGKRKNDGGSSCKPRGAVKCDSAFDGGVDNEGSALFRQFEQGLAPFTGGKGLDEAFAEDAEEGKRTILIYVEGWNGKPNDLDVQIGVFVSPSSTTKGQPQRWDGTQDWRRPRSSVVKDGKVIPSATTPGYVANGRLVVAKAGNLQILFGAAGLVFNSATMVGDLTIEGGIPKFVGIVGGRIPDVELLKAAGQLNIGDDSAGNERRLCQDITEPIPINPYKAFIHDPICAAVDVNKTEGVDFKDGECDAISSSIALTSFKANVVDQLDPDEGQPNPCSPDKLPPDFYTCKK